MWWGNKVWSMNNNNLSDYTAYSIQSQTRLPDTTSCIFHYIEDKLGCSPNILGSDKRSTRPPCHSTSQIEHLANLSKSFYEADDTEIYDKTKYEWTESSINILFIHNILLTKVPVSMWEGQIWPHTWPWRRNGGGGRDPPNIHHQWQILLCRGAGKAKYTIKMHQNNVRSVIVQELLLNFIPNSMSSMISTPSWLTGVATWV